MFSPKELAKFALQQAAWVLETEAVDFRWPLEKYQPAFDKIDTFREDKIFTDEEVGEVIETLAEGQPSKHARRALYLVAGILESKLVDFEWRVEKYGPVFDQLVVMRTDDICEDEELAEFFRLLAATL